MNRRNVICGLLGAAAMPRLVRAADLVDSVEIKTSGPTDLKDWMSQVSALIQVWRPRIVATLNPPGALAPKRVVIDLKDLEDPRVPAYTQDNTISVNAAYVRAHPDDVGMIAHELVHVCEKYPWPHAIWLKEGIADYIRYYVLLPDDTRRFFDPKDSAYYDGYGPTAGLLDYLERKRGPGAVKRINQVMLAGGDGVAELEAIAATSVHKLWLSYLATHPANAAPSI